MEQITTLSKTSVSPFDRWLIGKLLAGMQHPPISLVLWNGESQTSPGQTSRAALQFNSRSALMKIALNPELNFGDLYVQGAVDIVSGTLVEFITAIYGHVSFEKWGERKTNKWLRKLTNIPRPNSRSGSQENIHHHYDIGNEFYKLWLDDKMLYTCAYFSDADMSLESAQFAKMEHICKKLKLKPGQRAVEAGCGWGSFALHMAKHHGVKVDAYNISAEQIKFARAQADELGLSQQVRFIEEDYRNISGQYDVFVSVGMLEHVGTTQYSDLGNVIRRSLAPDGLALLHSIGRNAAISMSTWIEKRIFPGAYPPSLREMMDIFEPDGFSVLDVENLRLHYRDTLVHWLARFETNSDSVRTMFDEDFVRTWRLYLSGSAASFDMGRLQLFQVLFTHESNNQIPRNRQYVYEQQ